MIQTIERLIYRSQITRGLDPRAVLESILKSSERRNPPSGIVGALAFSGQTFVQALEGAPPMIDELMVRISADNRHTDIRILTRTPIVTSMFEHWSMAKTDLSQLAAGSFNALVNEADGEQLTSMLHYLASIGPSPRVTWI